MAEPQTSQFDRQCLEALKSIGKTLGQMTLYKIGHPAVAATLKLAEEHLAAALAQTPAGELVFSIDQDKLIANGRIVGTVGQVPTSVAGLFKRFKLNTLGFKAGLGPEELAAFCELAGSRTDSEAAADPQAYLAQKGVTRVVFHEAIYTKAGATPPPPPAAAPAAPEGPPPPVDSALIAALDEKSIDDTVQSLVNRAVPDPLERPKVYDRVMSLLQEDAERRIEEVTRTLRREKNILQNEQSRTQSVIENMVEGVVVVDDQGRILMMNPAAEQIYGTTLSQSAGKHLAEKAGEEHLVALASEITTPEDRPISKEVQVKAADDTRRTVKSAGAVVQNEAGKVVGMVSSLTDAAKHKELQRIQRDFVSHVTHELRAPLSSIRAALEILQGDVAGKLKEDENRMLQAALRNSDRLADLISSILDFSKIESGQMTVFPKKADAEKIAREAVESLGPWAQKKGIALTAAVSPELPPVSSDAKRAVQVLINLLSNAIKFTPSGGRVSVHVALSPSGGQGGERSVEFAVADTGSGIPKADQQKIFEKFVQIAAGEAHAGGTGLGLSIAKALVHLQGGKMWVDSAEGRGSTFYFTLPLYVAPRDTPAAIARKAPPLPWWKKLLGLKK